MFSRLVLRRLPRAQIQLNNKFSSSAVEEAKLPQNPENDMPINMENPFKKEKVQCILCKNKIKPDYKNVQLLSQFQSPYTGRIYGRHITGLCKRMQEEVETEIIKAQSVGFMGSMTKKPEFLKDPKLFDPEKPIRPHKY